MIDNAGAVLCLWRPHYPLVIRLCRL